MNCCAGLQWRWGLDSGGSPSSAKCSNLHGVLARVTEGGGFTLFPAARTQVLTGLAKRLKRAAQEETQENSDEIKVILAVTRPQFSGLRASAGF